MDDSAMERTKEPAVAALSLAAVVVFSASLIGTGIAIVSCDRSPAPAPATSGKRAADKVYTVRGEVRMLPAPKKPTAMLVILHEPIDDFENPDGTRGMSSMEMPFVPAASVALAEFAVGDKVEFDLSVWYAPSMDGKRSLESYRVTRMKKLPPDTKIKEGAAVPTLGG